MDEASWRRAVVMQVVRGDTHWNALHAMGVCQAANQPVEGTLIDVPDAGVVLVSVSMDDLICGFRRYAAIPNALRAWASALTASATWELTAGAADQSFSGTLLAALQNAVHGKQLSATTLAILDNWSESQHQCLEQRVPA